MKTKAPRSNPIRILTLLYKNNNYGAALQAYALWRHLADAAKCVDCGICSKVCDSLDTPRTETRCAYAAYALDDDFRAKSSSGGIAALLAERTVRRGGAVYGAAFDENLAVRHVEVNDIEGLDRLRGSKYVQSDVGDTYASAKKHLPKWTITGAYRSSSPTRQKDRRSSTSSLDSSTSHGSTTR